MSPLLWFFVAWFFLNAITTVAQIGKPRKPISAGTGAYIVTIMAVYIAAIFIFGWGLS